VVDIVSEPSFLEHVVKTSESLRDQLKKLVAKHPGVIEEVRGSGFLMGLKCVVPAGDLQTALREKGLLTVGAGENVLRVLPPLTIEESHVSEAVGLIDAACAGLARHAA